MGGAKLITLANGLRALLVSDMNLLEGGTVGGMDDTDMETDTDSETEHTDGEYVTDTDESMSFSDNECYDHHDHKPQHNKQKMSAACLCIDIGSFLDPDDIPGLAHFLEHMVFMGSEKYPDENDFDAYVTKHSGSSNAHTTEEQTSFYFDIESKKFFPALDRFANFFIGPLLKADAIDREIEAVDSEFKMGVLIDEHRRDEILSTLTNPGHPMSKFTWGNALTLKVNVEKQGLDIHDRVKQFWSRYYRAQHMYLVVISKETIEYLEEKVIDIFSPIKSSSEVNPLINIYDKLPFDNERYTKFYRVTSMKDMSDLYLQWCLPPDRKHYKEKPLNYISSLIGHEGKGSLYSALRRRHWANFLEAGNSNSAYTANIYWSEITIHVELTDTGLDHMDEVISLIFEYLRMLQDQPPSELYYNEIRDIEEASFRFQEMTDVGEYAEGLACLIPRYEIQDLLIGENLFLKFDSKLITSYLSMLTMDRMNMMLMSKQETDSCDLVEPWFGTNYCFEPLTDEQMVHWREYPETNEFHIPIPNTYIATDFTLKTIIKEYKYPVAIIDNDQGILFYCNNPMFNVPKGSIHFLLESNLLSSSHEASCLGDLYINILLHNLSEIAYEAENAQLEYGILVLYNGLYITVSGFDHKLSKFLTTLYEHITDFSFSDELWNTMVNKQCKDYSNEFMKQEKIASQCRLSILEKPFHGIFDRKKALNALKPEDLRIFAYKIRHSVYVHALIQGNISKREALEIYKNFLSSVDCKPIGRQSIIPHRCTRLPVGNFTVDSLTVGVDKSAVIVNYYQFEAVKMKGFMINELLMQAMKEPLFDFLRTRKQLGYSVYNTSHNTHGILGFSVTVCSQIDQFTMQQLDDYIEEFLREFQNTIDTMSIDDFSVIRDSLIERLSCEDTHFDEQVTRNWNIILNKTRNFDCLKKQIEILKILKLSDVQIRMKYYMDEEYRKKLSVQIMHGKNQLEDKVMEQSDVIKGVDINGVVVNVDDLLKSCDVYPFNKIQ